jgi:hypothetical protein
MTPPVIRAVIFTHGPDYPAAALASAALDRLGVEVVWAIDRAEAVAVPEGVAFIHTHFERRGNLNGIACVIGILETLAAVGAGADWVLKVDSDAMLLTLQWLLDRLEDLVGFTYAPSRGETGIFGFCYAFQPPALPRFLAAARARGETAVTAEDMVMGELGASAGSCHRHPFRDAWAGGANGFGPYSTWIWDTRQTVAWWVARYGALVVQPPKGMRPAVAKPRIAAVMREILTTRWPS